jgi:hypothetical protein
VYAACLTRIYKLNLGCLHPVARVISYDVGFNPSTQRHYRRLIYYIYIATCFGRTTIIRLLVYAACLTCIYKLNLGCLHPVARVIHHTMQTPQIKSRIVIVM